MRSTECGKVLVWGDNKHGQMARDQRQARQPLVLVNFDSKRDDDVIVDVVSGWTHVLALTSKSTLYWFRYRLCCFVTYLLPCFLNV